MYLNHRVNLFPGGKRGVIHGKVKRGKGVTEGTAPEGLKGKEGEGMREKGWEEKSSKAYSKNSDFGTPMI